MDWIVGTLLLVVGTIVGFFAAKYFLTQSKSTKNESQNSISERELLTEQALIHVANSRRMLEEVQRQSHALQAQMDAYEDMLMQTKLAKDGDSFKFFGEHATTFLRNQQKEVKPSTVETGFQPPDYSDGASGLLKTPGSSSSENETKS